MELRFYIDPETREPHIYRHGVSEEEVAEILRHRREDFAARGKSRIALGATDSGRHLQVVYAPEQGTASLFVITAYDLQGQALVAYRRRQRRRQRR